MIFSNGINQTLQQPYNSLECLGIHSSMNYKNTYLNAVAMIFIAQRPLSKVIKSRVFNYFYTQFDSYWFLSAAAIMIPVNFVVLMCAQSENDILRFFVS